jgi:hypothetical protein
MKRLCGKALPKRFSLTSKVIVRRVTQIRMVTKGYRKGVYDRVTEGISTGTLKNQAEGPDFRVAKWLMLERGASSKRSSCIEERVEGVVA